MEQGLAAVAAATNTYESSKAKNTIKHYYKKKKDK